jgi:uncharacterized membrane protein HdeD (DUF308 family)
MDIKSIIKQFFARKINIALIIIQVLAIIMFLLSGISIFCYALFFVFEGVFLIILGISLLKRIGTIKKNQDAYSQLPFSPEDVQKMTKNDTAKIRSIRFTGVAVIIVGIYLIFNIISVI